MSPKRARRKPSPRQRQEDVRLVVLHARQRQWHLTKAQALDPMMSSGIGRLYRMGLISEAQLAAGNAFGESVRAWALASGAPQPTAKTISYALSAGGSAPVTAIEDHRTEFVTRRLKRMTEALAQLPPTTASQVWWVCVDDGSVGYAPDELGSLREGLNALVRGLSKG
jgi:hypothetical protein